MVYLALVLLPLFALIVSPAPAGSGFWWDLSAAFGFAAAAMMAMMFILTARFKKLAAPFGIDLIYYFHRQIALVTLVFVLAHPFLLFWTSPELITFVRPSASPYHLDAGVAGFVCFLLLVFLSLCRCALNIEYDSWRFWHVLLALLAMFLVVIHIQGVGHYVAATCQRSLWLMIAVSCLAVVGYVRILKPLRLLQHPYRVDEVIKERGEAWTLVLRPDGHLGFTFLPGQFAWLTAWSSPFSLKEHPFSISSSAERPDQLRFTIKELGDFTRTIKSMRPDQVVYVDGPYGAFSVDRLSADRFVFIAGGIGIAPIMGMLRTLADRLDERPLQLFYAYSSLERLTFHDELRILEKRLNLTIVYILKNPPRDWSGEAGIISEDLLERHLFEKWEDAEYLVCGPTAMIDLAERVLHRKKVPLAKIHSELFELV